MSWRLDDYRKNWATLGQPAICGVMSVLNGCVLRAGAGAGAGADSGAADDDGQCGAPHDFWVKNDVKGYQR